MPPPPFFFFFLYFPIPLLLGMSLEQVLPSSLIHARLLGPHPPPSRDFLQVLCVFRNFFSDSLSGLRTPMVPKPPIAELRGVLVLPPQFKCSSLLPTENHPPLIFFFLVFSDQGLRHDPSTISHPRSPPPQSPFSFLSYSWSLMVDNLLCDTSA